MTCGTCHEGPFNSEPTQSRHRLAVAAAAGLGIVLLLGLHIVQGVSIWFVAPPVLIIVHILGFGFLATRLMQRQGTNNPEEGDALIRRPRLYDRFVSIAALGQQSNVYQRAVDLGQLRSGDAVLDVGSGTGSLLLLAGEHVGSDGVLCGVEPSAPMVAHARAKAVDQGREIDFRQGSATDLPFPDGTFDVVYCTMVLHHLAERDRRHALSEMHRVLKPAGRVVVADVQPVSILSSIFSVVAVAHMMAPNSLWRQSQVREALEQAGFVAGKQYGTKKPIHTIVAAKL